MDTERFANTLTNQLTSLPDSADVNTLVTSYNLTVADCVEQFAPKKTCVLSTRVRNPWFNEDIQLARRSRRRAERKWRKCLSHPARLEFIAAIKNVKDLTVRAKQDYLLGKLDGADNKTVFRTVNNLLHRDVKPLPACGHPSQLCTKFAIFFHQKVQRIRESLNNTNSVVGDSFGVCADTDSQLCEFNVVTEDSVKSVITKMSSSSCLLDPQPTWLMKKCLMSNLPALTRIVNLSLQSGIFPADAHQAIVTPIIKKTSLDKEDVKSYRPVSNLSYVTKLIEKVVATQFVDHLSRNELYDSMQSAYRANFSTETALMKLQNDILSAFDVRRGVLVVLLDLTAAFDTIDHEGLLKLLQSRFHLSGVAHQWMRSYLTGWSSRVSIQGNLSEPWKSQLRRPTGVSVGSRSF